MTLVTIEGIAPIKPGTRTTMRVRPSCAKDGSYEALSIVDTITGIKYHSVSLKIAIELDIRALDIEWPKKCFEIEKTDIYKNKTRFKAKEIKCQSIDL